jgi:hypothetical protein
MNQIEQVSFDPLASLLKQVAPSKANELDNLLACLCPVCELDGESEALVFRARPSTNTVIIGMKCTIRLEVHAHAAAIVFLAMGAPGYWSMDTEQKSKLYKPVDDLLNWAVSRDLQQWLVANGHHVQPEDVFQQVRSELPLPSSLDKYQREFGSRLFRVAAAFILLHELAHLHFGHTYARGYSAIQQEKDADRFAADWLLESASKAQDPQLSRTTALLGISVALLWLTLVNVYFGPQRSATHPESYDRLFQVLDHAISQEDDEESPFVWHFVSRLLFLHMHTAAFEVDAARMQGDPRDTVNYLIDLLSTSRRS